MDQRKSAKDKGQPWELDGLLGTPDGAEDEENVKGWKKVRTPKELGSADKIPQLGLATIVSRDPWCLSDPNKK